MSRGRDGRMLNQNVSRSLKVAKLSIPSKLLYTWLIPYGDDEGRLEGEPQHIKCTVIPQIQWTTKKISTLLSEIHNAELITWYRTWYRNDSKTFIQILDWKNNQYIRPDRFQPSKFPLPVKWQPLTDKCQPLTEQIKLNEIKLKEVKLKEVKGSEGSFSKSLNTKGGIPEKEKKEIERILNKNKK